MGIVFGVVAGYGIEWMGSKANWPSQVVNGTGLRLIGLMRRRSDEDLYIEPFRIAKAYLEAAVPHGNGGRALVVTSPRSGEGKSTIVEGLARAISENGTSVVMVSSDLRGDPTIEYVATPSNDQPGLSEYFLDESASLDDHLSDTSIDGVSLLARGSSPIDVIRRIDSTRMADLIRELRNRFDWVLLDSSGALETADVARLAPQTDGVLLVVDAHLSTVSATQVTNTLIRGSGASVIGFFHNRVRTNPVDLVFRRSGV